MSCIGVSRYIGAHNQNFGRTSVKAEAKPSHSCLVLTLEACFAILKLACFTDGWLRAASYRNPAQLQVLLSTTHPTLHEMVTVYLHRRAAGNGS